MRKYFKENDLKRIFKEEYRRHIVQFICEGLTPEEGLALLSPGLKVRHKETQFEYTIDHIDKDGNQVVLRLPEGPRTETSADSVHRIHWKEFSKDYEVR